MIDKGFRDSKSELDAKRHRSNMYSYLVGKLQSPNFLSETCPEYNEARKAISSFQEININSENSVELINKWADEHLTRKQVKNMQAALRQRRRRSMGVGKSITISAKAHRMLVILSEKDGLTLSETIEKRLKPAYNAEIERVFINNKSE